MKNESDSEAVEETQKSDDVGAKVKSEKKVETPEKKVNKIVFGKQIANSSNQTKEYNPKVGKYHPINDATWKRGER